MSVQVTYGTPGTYQWTCPDKVTEVDIEARGASSSDGTPGEVIRATLKVTPGTTYDLTVGAGGIVLAESTVIAGTHAHLYGGGGGGSNGSAAYAPAGHGGDWRGIPVPGKITLTSTANTAP